MAETKDAAKPAAKDTAKSAKDDNTDNRVDNVDTERETQVKNSGDKTESSDENSTVEYGQVPQADFPLTISVFDSELDREVHRTQVDYGRAFTDWRDLLSKDLPSGDLDHRFPGKKTVKVEDRHGKVVHEA